MKDAANVLNLLRGSKGPVVRKKTIEFDMAKIDEYSGSDGTFSDSSGSEEFDPSRQRMKKRKPQMAKSKTSP